MYATVYPVLSVSVSSLGGKRLELGIRSRGPAGPKIEFLSWGGGGPMYAIVYPDLWFFLQAPLQEQQLSPYHLAPIKHIMVLLAPSRVMDPDLGAR